MILFEKKNYTDDSFGPVCVLDLINRLQTTSTHTGRLVSVVLHSFVNIFSFL
jgi:hypothetical protein